MKRLCVFSIFDPEGEVDAYIYYWLKEFKSVCDRIIVVSSSEKHAQILSTQQDDQNISKYGLITKIAKVDDKDSAKATQIGQTMLKDLNKVKKAFNVTLFGNDLVRAGRILVFNQPLINLVGAYLVKNCSHTYNGKTHLMHLDLEERDG